MYEFWNRSKSPPLSDSKSVTETLKALRDAEDAADLPGRERLAEAQVDLVDLLFYLEGKMGFTFFPGEREKCARLGEQAYLSP